MKDRVAKLICGKEFILRPKGTLLFCSIGWALTAPLSTSYIGMAYCWVGIGLLLVCINIERPWLNIVPLPPLTTLQLSFGMKWAVGGMLLLLSRGETDYPVWTNYVQYALPINCITTTIIVIIGFSNYRIMRKRLKVEFQDSQQQLQERIRESLRSQGVLIFCYLTGTVAFLYLAIGVFSGTLDRGEEYLRWAGKVWKPDTVIAAVIRLRDIFYVIVPAIAWEWKKNRLVLYSLIFLTLLPLSFSIFLGSRGIILYPVFLIICGLWLGGIPTKAMRLLIVLAIVFSIGFVSIMGNSRGSFGNTASLAISQRVKIIIENARSSALNSKVISSLGREIYASSDPYMFRESAAPLRERGFEGFENIPYIWVPKFILPSQPEVLDGHLVAKEIEGNPTAGMHEGRHIHFPSITFGGDLYSRFRWAGVIGGSTLFGIFYALICRTWYSYCFAETTLMYTLLGLFPSTFLQGPPISTVTGTAWNWGYELPKYAIVLIVISVGIKFILRKERSRQFLK